MRVKGGPMCDRSNSFLRIQAVLAVLIAGFLIVPELSSIEATVIADNDGVLFHSCTVILGIPASPAS